MIKVKEKYLGILIAGWSVRFTKKQFLFFSWERELRVGCKRIPLSVLKNIERNYGYDFQLSVGDDGMIISEETVIQLYHQLKKF